MLSLTTSPGDSVVLCDGSGAVIGRVSFSHHDGKRIRMAFQIRDDVGVYRQAVIEKDLADEIAFIGGFQELFDKGLRGEVLLKNARDPSTGTRTCYLEKT